jgi:hypothetical protein
MVPYMDGRGASTRVIPVSVDGVELLVETVPVTQPGTQPTASVEELAARAGELFDRAQDAVVAVASSVAATTKRLRERGMRPDRVEVEFGLKFSAQGRVVVAAASGEASLRVLMSYDAPTGAQP